MHRRDVPGLLATFPKRLTDLEDACLQHGLANEGVGPNGFQELFFSDDAAGVVDQIRKHSIALRRELDAYLSAPDTLVCRIQGERGESLQHIDLPLRARSRCRTAVLTQAQCRDSVIL